MEYSKTVNLPQTGFSMKAGLTQKEPQYLERWSNLSIYRKQLEVRKDAPLFVLHDGPPYANGESHIGTAMNKTLKDMINKYKFLRGFRVPYVPGWDCHGLPIELKVTEKLGSKVKDTPVLELREQCRQYALKYVDIQKQGFVRLGIFGEWDNPYLTLSQEYETAIMESFGKLVEKDLIYRGMRPILWCPNCGTALAEAEIEYNDHTSPSIFVRFPVKKHNIAGVSGDVYVMIWTTTPWTLPANTGLSFHPDEEYVAVKVGKETLILAHKLMDSVLSIQDLKAEKKTVLTRADLESLSVSHPWIERESKVVFGQHVTMDTGTGIVHTAPGHGMDDYYMGLENGLEMLSPVDDEGKFTAEVPQWQGLRVEKANPQIIEFLEEKGLLYHKQEIAHSYPHCWRCRKPVIFRSKAQWFFRVSDKKLGEQVLSELPKVKWIPQWGEERIYNMLNGRPDWCLSRQRNWGVPIPAFYCKDCGEAVLTTETIAHIVKLVRKDGVEVWYKKEVKELMPSGFACPKCGGKEFSKETDILDVWFDSGVSNLAVLDQRDYLKRPADVYLEGSDQYRGWFQSSLWPSVAITGAAPYRTVITNGWVLDKEGRRMHKSLGNTVSPREIYDKFGADVFRVWAVIEDYTHDLRVGDLLIQTAADTYRKIRNTFRYLLGNLFDFTPEKAVKYGDMLEIDRFALALLHDLHERVVGFYDEYEFHRVFREIYNFCVVDMSNRYLDILKDRLYTYAADSLERRSAQTALYHILEMLMTMLTPILPFTMEEVFLSYFAVEDNDSVHLRQWVKPEAEWKNSELLQKYEQLMNIRETVQKALEIVRNEGVIGNSLAGRVEIKVLKPQAEKLLRDMNSGLRYFFIVSQAEIVTELSQVTAEGENVAVFADKARGEKCDRCWNYSEQVGQFADHPGLCERCAPVVRDMPVQE